MLPAWTKLIFLSVDRIECLFYSFDHVDIEQKLHAIGTDRTKSYHLRYIFQCIGLQVKKWSKELAYLGKETYITNRKKLRLQ